MVRACKYEARHARVGGRERDVEGVVHGRDCSFQSRWDGFTAEKVHDGVGAREDAAPRHAAGLLGVALDDSVAGRLGEPFAQ